MPWDLDDPDVSEMGDGVDPHYPTVRELQTHYRSSRLIASGKREEAAYKAAFDLVCALVRCNAYFGQPPPRRTKPPRSNPQHLPVSGYPGDCGYCHEEMCPPEVAELYITTESKAPKMLFHPQCWLDYRAEHPPHEDLGLWGDQPPPPEPLEAAEPPKARMLKAPMEYLAVPEHGKKVPRFVTDPVIMAIADFSIPNGKCEEYIRLVLLEDASIRQFAAETTAGRGTIRSVYYALRKDYRKANNLPIRTVTRPTKSTEELAPVAAPRPWWKLLD